MYYCPQVRNCRSTIHVCIVPTLLDRFSTHAVTVIISEPILLDLFYNNRTFFILGGVYVCAGNSGLSWSDVLLGNMPNVYVYAANNPSESILAKRRGYGTIISHNVPPYAR